MLTLLDAHVHVYPGADVADLLRAASKNFTAEARRAGAGAGEWRGVLFLTEIAGARWFESAAAAPRALGAWTVGAAPDDSLSLDARAGEARLQIVAGRQIVTAERIEVHALGTRDEIADGLELAPTVRAVRAADALPVLPWGVGKWLGRRGRLVATQLTGDAALAVSDNSGRPWFWRDRLLAAASAAGRPVLRGSDPLPLPGEERRVGAFGCRLTGLPAGAVSARAILARLAAGGAALHGYGRSESLARFLRNQLALRLHK